MKQVDQLKQIHIDEEAEIIRLGRGKTFGDWGVMYNINRTSSAVTLSPVVAISIEKDEFNTTIGVAT